MMEKCRSDETTVDFLVTFSLVLFSNTQVHILNYDICELVLSS